MDIRKFFGSSNAKAKIEKSTNQVLSSKEKSVPIKANIGISKENLKLETSEEISKINIENKGKIKEINKKNNKIDMSKKRKIIIESSEDEMPINIPRKKNNVDLKVKNVTKSKNVETEMIDSDTDDGLRKKKIKRKKELVEKKEDKKILSINKISDSESYSDEDPLPKKIRDQIKPKKRIKKDLLNVTDTIEMAFTNIPSASIKKPPPPAEESKQQKQYVNALDFFEATSAIQNSKNEKTAAESLSLDKKLDEKDTSTLNDALEIKSHAQIKPIEMNLSKINLDCQSNDQMTNKQNLVNSATQSKGNKVIKSSEKSFNKLNSKEEIFSQDSRPLKPTTPTCQVSPNKSCPATINTNKHSEYVSDCSQLTSSPFSQPITKESLLWVDKYKPVTSKQIIGQQGDRSNAKKLLSWLNDWNKYYSKKPVYGKVNNDGCGMRAALLSGPPGVGKTTTANIICKEAGYSFFELNASDTRSKKSLKEQVSEAINNKSLVGYLTNGSSKSSVNKHCLIMDEVDGMAGNEDRGGIGELILLIKSTRIPFICICNDRNHPKIRNLANYCFDLRFQRPRVDQIKGIIMSIAFKEGVKLPGEALTEIINAANHDIRQIIHNLSMWTVIEKQPNISGLQDDAKKVQKHLCLGPFDVCKKVFSKEEEVFNIHSKIELFFQDYSIGPLFVQENYLNVNPSNSHSLRDSLNLISKAAGSIAIGDIVDNRLRKSQTWSLLPTQAIFASVIPGHVMEGYFSQMIQFPQWLGKNSSRSKNYRIIQDLALHTSLNISANRLSLNLDYLPYMRHLFSHPLVELGSDGVDKVVDQLNAYDLLREDLDSIFELTYWPNSKKINIDSKVKANLTRTYNKNSYRPPFSMVTAVGKGRKMTSLDEEIGEEEQEVEESLSEKEDDSLKLDSMIKIKKTSTTKTAGKIQPKKKKVPTATLR